MSEPFIRLTNVGKTYQTKSGPTVACSDINLEIQKSEFVAIVGPSGCGKTTILKMVAGLAPYTSGSITIGGQQVDRPQTDVGIVFQEAIMLDWRDVLSNVMLQIDIRHMDRVKYETVAMDLLKATGLAPLKGASRCFAPVQIPATKRETFESIAPLTYFRRDFTTHQSLRVHRLRWIPIVCHAPPVSGHAVRSLLRSNSPPAQTIHPGQRRARFQRSLTARVPHCGHAAQSPFLGRLLSADNNSYAPNVAVSTRTPIPIVEDTDTLRR